MWKPEQDILRENELLFALLSLTVTVQAVVWVDGKNKSDQKSYFLHRW